MVAVGTIDGAANAAVDVKFPADDPNRLKNNLLALTANGAIKKLMVFSTVLDPASLADAAGATVQYTGCVGAKLGDFVLVSFSLDAQDITFTGYVQADGVLEVRIQNEGGAGVNLASGTLSFLVFCRN